MVVVGYCGCSGSGDTATNRLEVMEHDSGVGVVGFDAGAGAGDGGSSSLVVVVVVVVAL